MKKHRQKHASIRSIKKPGEQEGGAEERKEKSGNDWPWKFVTHERQRPERPERSEDQTRNQRRVFFLQLRQRESTPARFFAQTDEQKNKNEPLRQFAKFVRCWQNRSQPECGTDNRHGRETDDNGQAKNECVVLPADARPHETC